jgi:hypothetical protein
MMPTSDVHSQQIPQAGGVQPDLYVAFAAKPRQEMYLTPEERMKNLGVADRAILRKAAWASC